MATLEQLQQEHSRLCALAHDKGITVSEDLTVDFDTVLVGQAICTSLAKLIGVADGSEVEHTVAPKPKKAKSNKSTSTVKTTVGEQECEDTMIKTKKVAKAKKAPAKKTAKKSKAKKTTAKKSAVRKPREGNKTADVVALMKRKNGVTRAEVLKATGWKAVSMQQLAANAGVKMTVSKERPFTYKVAA